MPRRHRIEYEELDDLLERSFPDNPKTHDLAFLEESLEEFDFVMPVLVDDRTNLVGAGHGRLEELRALRDAGQEAPDGIDVRAGKWWVPVIRGVKFKSRDHLRKYILADNRGTELGGWDRGLVAKTLAAIGKDDLVGTGFGPGDYTSFLTTGDGAAPAAAAVRPWKTVRVRFRRKQDYEEFARLIGQTLTSETRQIWFPPEKRRRRG